jgi:3-(3-hydroxy-phenyl)propionate hydroxylase
MSDAYDVIVVGAGPIGLLMGNLLGGLGLRTLVLERHTSPPEEARAVSLDDEALRVLQAAGLTEQCTGEMIVGGVQALYVNGAGEPLFDVFPTSNEFGFPLFSLFHQPSLEATMRRGLERYPHVEIVTGREVDAVKQDATSVQVEGSKVGGGRFEARAAYLVGCDGGRSFVRESQNIGLSGATFRERWLVLDALTDESDQRIVRFFCDLERPAVRVPGPGGRLRWEFMLSPDENEEAMLEPAQIASFLARYPQPARFELRRKAVYTFHARNALRYRAGRVFLAGDAAHLMPPFFGQGVSTGCRDAHNLSWKLARVLRQGSRDALLDSYGEERRPQAEATIRASVMLGRVVMARSPWAGWLRDRFFQGLSRHAGAANFLREVRFKPPSKVSARAAAGVAWQGPLAGRLLPQPEVQTAGAQRPLDEELGTDFCVVGVERDPRSALPGPAVAALQKLGLRFITLAMPDAPLTEGATPLVDVKGRFADQRGQFFAVRPDRFVAAHFRANDALSVAQGLAQTLAAP